MKLFATLLVALLLSLAGAVAGSAAQPAGLQTKVNALVKQLENDPTDANRVAAEWELLKLGSEILALLPAPDKVAAKAKEPLAAVRATLEELRPRTASLSGAEMPLAEALKHLQKQTGLALADRRQGGGGKPVKLDLRDATYWQLAETFAAKTDSRISLYQPDGQVALVDGPNPKLPVSLHGPFRVAVKRISTRLDFDGKSHTGTLGLEIAWEPRFWPYLVEVGKLSFQAGPKSQPLVTSVPGYGPIVVAERNAKELEVNFPSPPRSVAALREVAGHFVVTMPSKSLALMFKEPMKGVSQAQDGVRVTVTKIAMQKDPWTVELTIELPAAGPTFGSFQNWPESRSWWEQASCQFERGAGETKQILRPDPLHSGVISSSPKPFVVRYQFSAKQNPGIKLGESANWRLACSIPGRMVEVTVPFSFKSIDLP